jgi:hypothetical protein
MIAIQYFFRGVPCLNKQHRQIAKHGMANIDICGDDVLYKFDQFRSLQALVLHRAKIGSTDEEKKQQNKLFVKV